MTPLSAATRPVDLAGRLRLWPGAAEGQPALHSSRPDLLPRLAPGRPAAQMPDLLAGVFSLCGHAHRWVAQCALAAALPAGDGGAAGPQGPAAPAALAASRQAHRLATLREQVLRLSHDWSRLLPQVPADAASALAASLAACPVWQPGGPADAALAAMPAWLQQHWLGLPLADWLQAYEADPAGWPLHWAARTPGSALARLLHGQQVAAQALAAPGPALCLLDQAALTLPLLARQMARPGFCAEPHWLGEHPDSGPWCRAADPVRRQARSAWDRLLARLVEVLRLAAPAGGGWLADGACALGPGEGVAWLEMSRGLLVHRVQLAPPAAGAQATVQAWQVLAPTEWNSHPQGPLARALRRLASGDAAGASRLAVAFDPCVRFEIASAPGAGDDAVRPMRPAMEGASSHA